MYGSLEKRNPCPKAVGESFRAEIGLDLSFKSWMGLDKSEKKRNGIPGMNGKMYRQRWENMPFHQDNGECKPMKQKFHILEQREIMLKKKSHEP